MKNNEKGITLIELLLGMVVSSAIFLVAGSAMAFLLGTSTKNRLSQSLEQTKNDIQVNMGNQVRWADKIDFLGGKLILDSDIYEVIDGQFYKNGSRITSSEVEITDFSVKRFATVSEAPNQANGSGLSGQYYDDKNFNELVLSRLDKTVDFSWGIGPPDENISADSFAVRWLGKVEPPENAQYTFYTTSDDGVRLWVDDKLIIDSWTSGGARQESGVITLSTGKRYSIRMDYFDDLGLSETKLYWSYKSVPKSIVPATRLYPSASSVSVEISIGMRLKGAKSVEDTLTLYLSPRGGFVGSIQEGDNASPGPSNSPILIQNPSPTPVPSATPIPTP
ncbi:hypothetical protein C4564_00950 [Candidatus Microgenomates bacterium]|nr:MAG: hypothetical protein C4564_00950 [Candidatus Microgenomates bacterium]